MTIMSLRLKILVNDKKTPCEWKTIVKLLIKIFIILIDTFNFLLIYNKQVILLQINEKNYFISYLD